MQPVPERQDGIFLGFGGFLFGLALNCNRLCADATIES